MFKSCPLLKVTIHDNEVATTAADVKQLDAALKAASEEAGAITVEAGNANRITIAVGGDGTVSTFDYGHRSPLHYASKGIRRIGVLCILSSPCMKNDYGRALAVLSDPRRH